MSPGLWHVLCRAITVFQDADTQYRIILECESLNEAKGKREKIEI